MGIAGALLWSGAVMADLNTGLIAHWTFDDCTAKDSGPNSLDGAISGDPQCVDGVNLDGETSKALAFDGNDFIQRLYSDIPAGNFSVAMWVKATDKNSGLFSVVIPNQNGIDGGGNDRHIYLSNGQFCQRVWAYAQGDPNGDGNTQYISCTAKKLATGFNHIAYIVTDTKIRQYINGKLALETDGRPSEFDWRDRFLLGYSSDAAHDYFSGVIDDFRYYSRELTAEEINEIFAPSITVSGALKGLKTKPRVTVECTNLTTGKSVSLQNDNFNCESSGLSIHSGDKVDIHIQGVAQ